ncbi:hypothetical protein PIROE2DRAFT_4183 [Piromyces sp. E2]|nr:hypothetical protein PIROE2DRAFT_4183 [Piromyces sp. E2]|eukprot:OUM68180.1 hypothetical protein PIROE2DRAFT_4183 [Piromyces sp. E2]
MLVLENTIFTFNQFPQNNVGEYDDTFDPTLMDDYTQNNPNQYMFAPDKIDYDDYCPSPGIVDSSNDNNEGNSLVRRHRFSICKANDPQAIIAYRRLSNACSSIIPSPNGTISTVNIGQSYQSTPYIAPALLFDDKRDDRKISSINECAGSTSPTLDNSIFLNASTSCPNIISSQPNDSYVLSPKGKLTTVNPQKEMQSPFHTILTPNTFGPIMTPYQIIDTVGDNGVHDLDEQFRLFNYNEEDEDLYDDDSLPSALNSNSQLNSRDNSNDIVLLNPRIRLNSNNNIKDSEIVTSYSMVNSIKKPKESNNETTIIQPPTEKVRRRSELEIKIMESIEKAKIENKIKTYSQNIQGLYGLWKSNLGVGFKSILRE